MPYTENNIIRSERAFEILHWMINQENGTYATELSEKIKIDRSQASEILRKLNEMGLIKENSVKSRATHYEIDFEELIEFFKRNWYKYFLRKDNADIETEKFIMEAVGGLWKNPEEYELMDDYSEEWEKQFDKFIESYLRNYIFSYQGSTLEQMVTKDFREVIDDGKILFDNLPDYIFALYEVMNAEGLRYWRDDLGLFTKILDDLISSELDLDDYSIKIDPESLKISELGQQSYHLYSLLTHQEIEHKPSFLIKCDICDTKFSKKSDDLSCNCRVISSDEINKEILKMINFE